MVLFPSLAWSAPISVCNDSSGEITITHTAANNFQLLGKRTTQSGWYAMGIGECRTVVPMDGHADALITVFKRIGKASGHWSNRWQALSPSDIKIVETRRGPWLYIPQKYKTSCVDPVNGFERSITDTPSSVSACPQGWESVPVTFYIRNNPTRPYPAVSNVTAIVTDNVIRMGR